MAIVITPLLTKLTKSLLVLLSALGCSFGLASESDKNGDTLHLISYEAPPYIITGEKEPQGLAIQYVKTLMERSQQKFKLTLMPPKRALLFALSNSDSCVFPIERSQEREVKLSWISPITISRHGLFSNPKLSIPNIRVLNDIQGLRVGSYLGSVMGEYLVSLDFKVDVAAENKANLAKLMAGRVDLWMSEIRSANYISAQKGINLGEPKLTFFTTLGAIGCNLEIPKSTIGMLNRNLQKMYRDGTIDEIKSAFENKTD